jgi:hypothetical protein
LSTKSSLYKSTYPDNACESSSGAITPLESCDMNELSDDSTHKSSSLSVINLGSVHKMGVNLVQQKLEISENEEAYPGKGRSGSIGEFETIDLSQPSAVSSIYPLRLFYPKSRPPQTERSKSALDHHHFLNERPQSSRARTFRLRAGTLQSSLLDPPSSSGHWTIALHDVGNRLCKNEKDKEPINNNHSDEPKNLPPYVESSSWATCATLWSEDDKTSVGKSASVCSSESVITFKGNNIWPKNTQRSSLWPSEEWLPKLPMAKSKNTKNEHEVSLWPTEDQTTVLSKIPEVKSEKKSKTRPRSTTFTGKWKPAKYDIPDPIADIKKKGIFAPLGLYSSSPGSRKKSNAKKKAKRIRVRSTNCI